MHKPYANSMVVPIITTTAKTNKRKRTLGRHRLVCLFVSLYLVALEFLVGERVESSTRESWSINSRSTSSSSLATKSNSNSNSNTNTTRISIAGPPLPLCNRQDIRVGHWKPVVLTAPPYIPSSGNFAGVCPEIIPNSSYSTHEWQPSNNHCHFTKFDPQSFCQLASMVVGATSSNTSSNNNNNEYTTNQTRQTPHTSSNTTATLAIVGDSLSFEHYSSLVQSLGLDSPERDNHKSNLKKMDIVHWLPCDNNNAKRQWKLVFRRTNILKDLPQTLQANEPHIVILNRGAHYTPDEKFIPQFQATIAHLQTWQTKCQLNGQKCWLFYRTSVPGHPRCYNFTTTGPSDSISDMEAWIGNLSNYVTDAPTVRGKKTQNERLFYWWRYKFQNELAVSALRESSLSFQVLDAYDINILRPDRHRGLDCLHSCYPGKMDVYNQMLLHYLKASIL
jgi:hypothetical protein